ncbi:7414_t:CDS:2 [Ambispora leptoticha]|uniref:7414_t:CDS:1 n=1 Tax=Ambispora leptoticha TaxID=144679 RepID=A0A9N8W989_9GLOM|nr:7414_t:CDS:2 [Ambispora leptoticha]
MPCAISSPSLSLYSSFVVSLFSSNNIKHHITRKPRKKQRNRKANRLGNNIKHHITRSNVTNQEKSYINKTSRATLEEIRSILEYCEENDIDKNDIDKNDIDKNEIKIDWDVIDVVNGEEIKQESAKEEGDFFPLIPQERNSNFGLPKEELEKAREIFLNRIESISYNKVTKQFTIFPDDDKDISENVLWYTRYGRPHEESINKWLQLILSWEKKNIDRFLVRFGGEGK